AKWRRIDSLPGVADSFFVNDIKADLHDADTVYAVVDNHKAGDFEPYVYKSADRGNSWQSMSGDLPDRHLVWRLVQDHERADLFFAGTEFGVFFTVDSEKWIKLTGKVPNIPFRDLAIQKRENDLVGATFGRSFFVFDDYSALRHVNEEVLEQEAELFPVREAKWYIPRRPFGFGEKGSQGDAFYSGPNPPFGAVFTYYLKDSLKTRKEVRQEEEKEIAEEGGDTPYPGWDALREEELEEEPAIVLTVSNAAGEVVRRVTGPAGEGFHRVAWDLRYPSFAPEGEEGDFFSDDDSGYLAAPGTYTVSLAKRSGGTVTDLGKNQTFDVVPLRTRGLVGADPAQVAAFMQELATVQRRTGGTHSVMNEAEERLEAIKMALTRSTAAGTQLGDRARALLREMQDLHVTFDGNEMRETHGDPGPATIQGRLGTVGIGNMFSTYGPTAMHQRQFEIAKEEFEELATAVGRIVSEELPALEAELDAAGVPWSMGRGVPQ
ncbi:MAG: glycosyl hydrolase, partial [Acidobacteria bacterium]|nr:glycosyl hydrolase [Acidobacteriota bacterium]